MVKNFYAMEISYEKFFVELLLKEWKLHKKRLLEEVSKELDTENNSHIFYIIFNPVRKIVQGKTKFICKWAGSRTLPMMEMNTACIKVDCTNRVKCEFLWMLPKGCKHSLNKQIRKWYDLYVYAKLSLRQAFNVDNSSEYLDKSEVKDFNQRLYKMRLLAMKAEKREVKL